MAGSKSRSDRRRVFFEPVDTKIDFPASEKKLVADWYKKGLVKKYLRRNNSSKKHFSFMDGPITANNPMGVHHAWGRTYKDLWQRFNTLRGFKQRYQNGFDCQGLWVEVEVEKELGFKNKKDIEKFGIAKFVQLCRDRVKKYSQIQTEQSKRLGYFADWDNSYYTLSDDNNYMIWHFLKVCHENGWIYKGKDSVPWCPRCETAISQHEMLTEDYKEITHESIFLAFPLTGQENEYLAVWTTTPWTIPANIAVAVDENMDYSQVLYGGKKYWAAAEAVERVFPGKKKIVKTVKGSKLVGLKYKGAFDDLPAVKKISDHDRFHSVIPTDNMIMPITAAEGTGLVHTAVSAGAEDFKLGQKLGLPMVPVIRDNADYLEGLGFLSGKNAKNDPRIIFDYFENLEKEGKTFFIRTEKYKHRYPACWRCKSELVWKVADEWYIAMDKPLQTSNFKPRISDLEKWDDEDEEKPREQADKRTLRERMMDAAQKITWIPSFGLDREMDWLKNMHDWLISKKNRYWGLALPIWECKKCGHFEVIGSKDELKEKASSGWNAFKNKTPHKPEIDGVKIKCVKCGREMDRIESVGNPWLDAGIVSFSTISSNNKAAGFEPSKTKPLYLTDRNEWQSWFPADFITESFPGQFKNWFYAMIAMSTVLENTNPMKTVLGFGTLLGEDGRPMHKSWGNSIEFNEGADKIGADVMRWMFVRQNPAENMLFGYKVADEVRRRFHIKLWNVYNFFVTYANLDGYKPSSSQTSKIRSQNILDRWILARLDRTIGSVTAGLEKFDAYAASGEIEKFVDDLSLWYIRRSRSRVGPAAESEKDKTAFYETTYRILLVLSGLLAPFNPFISETIYKNLTKKESIHLSDWPAAKKIKPEDEKLIAEMEKIREFAEKAHAIRKEKVIPVKQPLGKLQVKNYKLQTKGVEKLLMDELNVKNVVFKPGKGSPEVTLDTKITAELKEEMRVREIVRSIQEKRKEMGLSLSQKVNVYLDELPKDKKLIQWMMKRAQIKKLEKGKFKMTRV